MPVATGQEQIEAHRLLGIKMNVGRQLATERWTSGQVEGARVLVVTSQGRPRQKP